MNQTGESKPTLKARKAPQNIFPVNPPKVSPNTEVVYYALNPSLLDAETQHLKDQIVTSQLLYKPGLLAAARVAFLGSRWELHHKRDVFRVIAFPPQPQMGDWDNPILGKWDAHNCVSTPEPGASYVYDSSYDFSLPRMEELQEEFISSLISHEVLEVQFNPVLKLDKKLDETEDSFQARCLEKTRQQFDLEVKTLEETLQRLQNRLKEKLEREVREIGKETLEMQSVEEPATERPVPTAESRRKRVTPPEDHQAQMAVRESIAAIDDLSKELEDLQVLREAKMKEFEENIAGLAKERQKDILRINRSNVEVLRFSIIWLPYTEYVIQEGEERHLRLIRSFELPDTRS